MNRFMRLLAVIFVAALCAMFAIAQPATTERLADKPVPRTDRNSQIAHEQLVAKAKQGGIDVYFLGDSITRRWGATDYRGTDCRPDISLHWRSIQNKTLQFTALEAFFTTVFWP
jgi:hypothetical protein